MGELPERAAYVGDMFRVDVLGARAAGLFPILIDFDGGHADKACARVASLAEVGRVLAALG
jgi:FMN phosphatase YigB (HAD superfamily)